MLAGHSPGQPATDELAGAGGVGLDDLRRSLQSQLFHDCVKVH